MKRTTQATLSVLVLSDSLAGQVIYPTVPDWQSTDSAVATGGALVDIDRDGWLDLVVSNGNDIVKEPVAVYYNHGDGTWPVEPDWESINSAYHGHLSTADVNGDGWIDVAVAVLLNQGGRGARLYLNDGGTLASFPSWQGDEVAGGFAVGFGDMNGDGRPDLAFATGFPYGGTEYPNYVHLNVGGALETAASWMSDDTNHLMDVVWYDVNGDGWLDLIGAGAGTYTWIYLNQGGVLDTTASWHNADPNQFCLMVTCGDLTGDGFADLITADNNQLNDGTGRFKLFPGLAEGLFEETEGWSYYDGYVSAIAVGDLDADDDLDLVTGAWFDRTRCFLNAGGELPVKPSWTSAGTSVPEAVLLGDVNNDARRVQGESFVPTPGVHLYQLGHQPIETIVSVTIDGVEAGPGEYTVDTVHGWVSIGPEAAGSVEVVYVWSEKLDLAVTTWDSDIGNGLYYNLNEPPAFGDADGDCHVDLGDYAALQDCMSGPAGYAALGCERFDFDTDGRVDLHDFGAFQAAFTGPDVSIPGCSTEGG